MPIQRHNRVLTMRPEQWETIDRIAQDLRARNTTGRYANTIAWSALIKGIADGEYVVELNSRTREQIRRIDKAIEQNEKRERKKTPAPEYKQLSLEPEPA